MFTPDEPKALDLVRVEPPPEQQRVRRNAKFVAPGERRTRYSLPVALQTASPVGYRERVALTEEEARQALALLSLGAPTAFAPCEPLQERELFEEASLGVLSSRQSTNFRGQRQVTVGGADIERLTGLLRQLDGLEVPVLDKASYGHVILTRRYQTPFTFLLTFVGHERLKSLASVPTRAVRKRRYGENDIPTIGYLQQIHLGVLADTLERAVVVASQGKRRAQIFMRPVCGELKQQNAKALAEIEALCGVDRAMKRDGWEIGMLVQVGGAIESERVALSSQLWRKLGANMLSFRSERIQPGVNNEDKAPGVYQQRQDMDVSDAFTYMAGRAAYNGFSRWSGIQRDRAKDLLLLERVDVLTPGGKERLRSIRRRLDEITDKVVEGLPKWADLPTGKALSRNAAKGRKAFALAGQRIYIAGLSKPEVADAGIAWDLAVRSVGAASARSGLYAELMGVVDLPDDCDLLAGICMMAGPVNQDDIGKTYYGGDDLLTPEFADRDPTSLLVWTLKGKTVADPIGNEEQLLNPDRKGALVDLRPGPHDVVDVLRDGARKPLRQHGSETNEERAFGDVGNFVTDPDGKPIPGNRGRAWPHDAGPVFR